MNVKIIPHHLSGEISAISSKSDAHRALICAALADKPCEITLNTFSQDIMATCSVLTALGAQIEKTQTGVVVRPVTKPLTATLDCSMCGSTARFILPVACALDSGCTVTGSGSLLSRPFAPLINTLCKNGAELSSTSLPTTVMHKCTHGQFMLTGRISSQFISGLMLAAPLYQFDTEIIITDSLESRAYVDMTLAAMRAFGVNVQQSDNSFLIPRQTYASPESYYVEGDWSNSAFFLCGGGDITVNGLSESSLQADKAVKNFLSFLGNTDIDASPFPDLIPAIAALAAVTNGTTRFFNAGRLAIKESNRLESIAATINGLGGEALIRTDELIIKGKRSLSGGTVNSFNDHRIVMLAAILSQYCTNSVIIENADAVSKSYPSFFKDFSFLGGKYHVL